MQYFSEFAHTLINHWRRGRRVWETRGGTFNQCLPVCELWQCCSGHKWCCFSFFVSRVFALFRRYSARRPLTVTSTFSTYNYFCSFCLFALFGQKLLSPSSFALFTVTLCLISLSFSHSFSVTYMPHIKRRGKEQLFNQNCHFFLHSSLQFIHIVSH